MSMPLQLNGFPSGFSVKAPPPIHFTPAGDVLEAVRCEPPPRRSEHPSQTSASKKAGLLYQKKVAKRLVAEFGAAATIEPWFRFRSRGSEKWRYCSPDALLMWHGNVIIVETKITHTPHSWYQLAQLYKPVVQAHLGLVPLLVSIVKSYDPATPYPEEHDYIFDVMELNPDKVGILRWK